MPINCGQTVIPTTNETPLPCNEYISSRCIIHEPAIPYLGLADTTPLETVITSITSSLIDARNRVLILEGQSTTVEGVDILSTGESIGKVLQADGDGTSSWVTLLGGGNALTTNPLSQFAATTKAQLDGVISDGDVMYVGDAPTAHTHTFASLTSRPTTISGYGITDFNSLGDARWATVAHTHALSNLTQSSATLGQVPTWSGTAWVAATPAGGTGGVSKVGTPVNNQIGVWTGDGTIEGDANLTWTGSIFNINSGSGNSLNFNNGTFKVEEFNSGFFQATGNQLNLKVGTSGLNSRLYANNQANTFYTALQFEAPTTSVFVNVRNLGGTLALTSDIPTSTDTSEWATYSGTRLGSDLQVYLGDYDNTNNGTLIEVDDFTRTAAIGSYVATYPSFVSATGSDVLANSMVTLLAGNNRLNVRSGGIRFQGSYNEGQTIYYSWLKNTNLTADRTYEFPNATGTVALTSDLSNYVALTGAQSITGLKTFTAVGTTASIRADNSGGGNGVYTYNSGVGNGLTSVNLSTGIGIKANNSSSGIALEISNTGTGDGIQANSYSSGNAIYANSTSVGQGIVSNVGTGSTAFAFIGKNNGTNTFTVNKTGDIVANSITTAVKKYVALLNQSSTSAPVATVLENSLGGTVTWARTSAGVYTATLTGAFTSAKTVVFLTQGFNTGSSVISLKGWRSSSNVVQIETASIGAATPSARLDDVLSDSSIEIRVYP